MKTNALRSNPWPYAITGWMLLFAIGMAAWVVVAVRNDPELVRPDYYEQEIAYQKQIDRLGRTAAVRREVSVAYDPAAAQIAVRIPAAHLADKATGTIHFYRPSNAKLDFELPLAMDATGGQTIPTAKLEGGLWKVRVAWRAGDQDFYFDQSLIFTGGHP